MSMDDAEPTLPGTAFQVSVVARTTGKARLPATGKMRAVDFQT